MFFSSVRSLRKSTHIFKVTSEALQKNRKRLTPQEQKEIERGLQALREALKNEDRQEADRWAGQLEILAKNNLSKSWLQYGVELIFALTAALIIATIV